MHLALPFLSLIGIVGALLLAMALSSAQLRRLPISTAAVYLGVGIVFGPSCLNWARLDVTGEAVWLERTTECALIISLFVGGLRLRQPIMSKAWTAVSRLAFPVLLGTIGAIALFAHVAFGLSPGRALLIAAVLSPTDPVLASAVSVSDAADRDRLRYGLSGEAGLNDGLAFPFVLVALAWERGDNQLSSLLLELGHALAWSIPVGLLVGYTLGLLIGRVAIWLRSRHRDTHAPSDFLALALIALSYFAAQSIGALGFLAAFAAGIGLRRSELKVVQENPHPDAPPREAESVAAAHPPAEHLVHARVTDEAIREPAIAAGVLVAETISFGDTAERLLEVTLVILVGVAVVPYWDVRGLIIAGFAFVLVRPVFTHIALIKTPTTTTQRWLLGWFGVRGIGSLYYLSYALNHTADGQHDSTLTRITLTVVATSIVIHGITAHPLLASYERLRQRRGRRRDARARAEGARGQD